MRYHYCHKMTVNNGNAKTSFNRTANSRITRLNLVSQIVTKQYIDFVFPSGLCEKATVYKQLALRWQIFK